MQDTDVLDRRWRDEGLSRPLHRALTFTQAGLALGRGTLLAAFEKERLARGLALEGNEARLFSLLTAAHGKPAAGGVIAKLRRAGEFWCAGEKALAQIHLAFIGLPRIDEADAYRLFLARVALEKGLEPSDLVKALGFPQAARDLEKYNPDQPRVPAGSGRESGEWTTGDGGATGASAESQLPRNVHVKPFVPNVVGGTVSDANPDGIVPGAQYAQANPVPIVTPDIIDKIKRDHGPGAKDKKGEFFAQFANEERIKWLIQGAWANSTPMHVGAGNTPDRVVLGGTVWEDDETGTHEVYIGWSARKLKTPSIETNAYVVILDSNNYVITCYPISPDDPVFPYEE
ncbi:MAG: bacterial transcriptional activator domain-containing protein [Methylocella sp.]